MKPEKSVVEDSGKVKTGNGQGNGAGTGSIGHRIRQEKAKNETKAPATQPADALPERIAEADQDEPRPDKSLQQAGTTGRTDKKPVISRPAGEVERKREE